MKFNLKQFSFKNMSIKAKLMILVGFVLVASAILGISSITSLTDIRHTADEGMARDEIKDFARQCTIHLLESRRSEKDFLMRKDTKYIKRVAEHMDEFLHVLDEVDATGLEDSAKVQAVREMGNQYHDAFKKTAAAVLAKGSGDQGIIGEFRAKVHQVEEAVKKAKALQLQVDMLMLRRAEKDYLLRGTEKYVKKMADGVKTFNKHVSQANLSYAQKQELGKLIYEYHQDFLRVVAVDQEIAKDTQEFRAAAHNLEPALEAAAENFAQHAAESMAQIPAHIKSQLALTLIIILTGSVVMIALSVFIIRAITRPVAKLHTGLEQLGEGDLTAEVNVDSKDEIGAMAQIFNDSMTKLRDVMRQVNGTSNQVNTASTNISSASEQLAAGAEEQQSQLSEVATTMEEMSAMILEASKNADDTRQNAQSTGSTASKGREVVGQTVEGFKTVATTVERAAHQISELNKRSEDIGNVIQVIDEIADQTNLLALNANIEAARAGEAGRGFAVVADEVRKLAERTVSATGEIGKMIESIQGDITAAVDSMEEIQKQSNDGLELVGTSDQSLEEISGSITQVVGAVEQIATSANEQSSGAEEISKNIEGVSTVAKQSASSAQELAASAEQLSGEIVKLNELINQFKVD